MSSETVVVAGRTGQTSYHADGACRKLRRAKSTRDLDRDTAERLGLDPCPECVAEAEYRQPGDGGSLARHLEELDPEEVVWSEYDAAPECPECGSAMAVQKLRFGYRCHVCRHDFDIPEPGGELA